MVSRRCFTAIFRIASVSVHLIPIGLMLAGASAAALALNLPVIAAAVLEAVLSLGYDLTQPLLAGTVTDLGPQRGLTE
jgi:hypothetical protein